MGAGKPGGQGDEAGADSGPSERILRKRAGVLKRILDTALRLISERGIDAVTLQAVAEELDYTPGALYRYVASKDDLIVAAQRQALGEMAVELRELRERFSQRPEVREASRDVRALGEILSLGRYYAGLLDESPEDIALIALSLGPRTLVPGSEALDIVPTLYEVFGEVVQSFQSAEQATALAEGDAIERAVLYWSTLQGVLQLDKLKRLEAKLFDARRLASDLTPTLLRGWGAEPAALERARALVE